jgi:mono/diheme cytochrome c family protein
VNSSALVRRLGRLGAVICVLMVAAACATDTPAAGSASQSRSPKQTFERACAKCHGADGRGGLPMVAGGPAPRNLRDAGWQASRSDNEVLSAIRDGRGAMPPFRDVLTTEEQEAALLYVREIGRTGKSAGKDGR